MFKAFVSKLSYRKVVPVCECPFLEHPFSRTNDNSAHAGPSVQQATQTCFLFQSINFFIVIFIPHYPGYIKSFQKNGENLSLHTFHQYLLNAHHVLGLGAQHSSEQDPNPVLKEPAASWYQLGPEGHVCNNQYAHSNFKIPLDMYSLI